MGLFGLNGLIVALLAIQDHKELPGVELAASAFAARSSVTSHKPQASPLSPPTSHIMHMRDASRHCHYQQHQHQVT